ncbi:DUF3465 domain-containing protein [Acinetobacter gerneri]|uniref:DUF3465 domain-containing protein n=1 Tax=Acinetobacter gerneri TaxID=202952 RepID=UPI002935AC52|nr:DUF3465 domain-containing protein [Acinetobacter gerneri]MDV2441089.1 DUF3465 domain-containing protein [Acinetobacter gerneri]
MGNKSNIGIIALIIFAVAAYFGFDKTNKPEQNQSKSGYVQTDTSKQDARDQSSNQQGLERIQQAYEKQQRDVPVQAEGIVKAVLKDDNEGSRHQKFILKLENGLTVLVAHNIDLAPKIENLHKGDQVQFKGDYEYSNQGGVIHWTHRDPRGHHADGWLKHDGKTYQ